MSTSIAEARRGFIRVGVSFCAALVITVAWCSPAIAAESMVRPGGMTLGHQLAAVQAEDLPSCYSISYPGTDGTIAVQTTNGIVSWGISMTPADKSIGQWNVYTYLNGKRTTSAFNRTLTGAYILHGSISASSGQVFRVDATDISVDGNTYFSVPNNCRVP